MQFGRHKLKLCKYGWMLFHGPYIGTCFDLYGEYSQAEVDVMTAFIAPGDTVLDIGANIGDLTLPIARAVGAAGRVYAVESNIDVYHVLCANLALNGVTNVKALNYFVSDSDTIDTAGPWGRFGFVSETWGAGFLAVDAIALDRCDFIKIDVDGKELSVLRSAEKTIARFRPVIYFENDVQAESEGLLGHILALEYDLYWHPAPIFRTDNFFGNPVNHWAPTEILSLMMLAVPKERAGRYTITFRKVAEAGEWW